MSANAISIQLLDIFLDPVFFSLITAILGIAHLQTALVQP